MDLADIGPRPRIVRCVRCNRSISVAWTGRLPLYCSKACKQVMFYRLHPRPKPPKVPLESRVAERVWQMLVDAKVIAADLPMPPRREQPGSG
jgi:hypothetical protein